MIDRYENIKPIYKEYMECNFPQTPDGQWLQCEKFCRIMKNFFPDLEVKRGVVYSYHNIDNPSDKYPRQYTHWWLFDDENNTIVDPTILQFHRLGNLIYEEWDEIPKGKCLGCGHFRWKEDLYCGRCEWSHESC